MDRVGIGRVASRASGEAPHEHQESRGPGRVTLLSALLVTGWTAACTSQSSPEPESSTGTTSYAITVTSDTFAALPPCTSDLAGQVA
jgi:hypothetical protein